MSLQENDPKLIQSALFNSSIGFITFLNTNYKGLELSVVEIKSIYHRLRRLHGTNADFYRNIKSSSIPEQDIVETHIQESINSDGIDKSLLIDIADGMFTVDYSKKEVKSLLLDIGVSICKDLGSFSPATLRDTLRDIYKIEIDYDTAYKVIYKVKNFIEKQEK